MKGLSRGRKNNMDDGGKGMTENQINALKQFWGNLKNVEQAHPENIRNDVSAYLEEIESLRSQLQQAEQERDERKERNERDSRLLKKWRKRTIEADRLNIRALRAEKERDAAMEANTAMREDIQRLYDDYDRRIQSAAEMLQNPSTSVDQQKRVSIKRGEYRSFLAELYSILSRYPKEGDTTCETDTAKK